MSAAPSLAQTAAFADPEADRFACAAPAAAMIHNHATASKASIMSCNDGMIIWSGGDQCFELAGWAVLTASGGDASVRPPGQSIIHVSRSFIDVCSAR